MILILELAAYAQKKGGDKGLIAGYLQADELGETSGIAASTQHPDTYYIHNDSGDTNRFFAISSNGKLKGTYYYQTNTGNVRAYDCEDIAMGPGPVNGQSYIYLGDIGDNGSYRKFITVYRMAEPELPATEGSKQEVAASALNLKYPDGARDAETLMVDPVEKLIYVVSKRESQVAIYTAPLSYHDNDTVTMTRRCQIHFKGIRPFKWIVAGDISHDGSQVLLKSYTRVYYWKRQGNEPVWQTMQRPPQELSYEQEHQGEAIGFATDGHSYYTVSEGKKSPIYHYQLSTTR
ncbi:hypothetical protein HH214_04155 [Mucilaginibacter robiniae]|uniref:PE-PGRS family protein n=1 Tax=Mucilaginibacter robiniae TaxID=2728022 RepID=A0A7L5E436_9SPHI|nr:hypothetical protein [Mucilaginibacter robiniae]QJD95126.1 hypothetical protein HH214_04155 [Mucilaginibacter robiniae]